MIKIENTIRRPQTWQSLKNKDNLKNKDDPKVRGWVAGLTEIKAS